MRFTRIAAERRIDKQSLHTRACENNFTAAALKYSKATHQALKKLRAILLLPLACLLPALVTAQDIDSIETELRAEIRVEITSGPNKGLARFIPATVLSQGEVVYYTLRIRNPSSEFLREVTVVQRIPVNTVYVENSASGPDTEITFSADGGQSFAPTEQLKQMGTDGVERIIRPEQYTHIRWRMRHALAPGAVALARFRAVFQ